MLAIWHFFMPSLLINCYDIILTRVCFSAGYRLNKFCGEHLVVVNESPEPDPIPPPHQRSLSNDIEKKYSSLTREANLVDRDGPIAEALIQNEQMFHHLKILKPSPSEMENERRKSVAASEQVEKPAPRKGIYSQVCVAFFSQSSLNCLRIFTFFSFKF